MTRAHFPIITFALAFFLSACVQALLPTSKTNQPQTGIDPGRKLVVTKGTIENKVTAPGKLIARSSASMVFPISSQVAEVSAKEGDKVSAGDTLLVLDTTSLDLTAREAETRYLDTLATYSLTLKGPNPVAVRSARAAVVAAQLGYKDLQSKPSVNDTSALNAATANAEAAVRIAQSNYDKARSENPAGIGASPEGLALEQATNNYVAAKSAYERAFEAAKPGVLASASSQIVAAQANLNALTTVVTETIQQAKARSDQAYLSWQQALLTLQKAVVLAPIDGIVTSIAARKDDVVLTGAPAVEITDVTAPFFEANVDEADLGGVRIGQKAQITVQAYPDNAFAGTVTAVAPVGTIASNVVTFKVRLSLSEDPGVQPGEGMALLPGMSGKSELTIGSAKDVIVIPISLLTRDPDTDEYSVQRVQPGDKIETVKVKTGIRDSTDVEITAGLNEGDVLLMPQGDAKVDASNPGAASATATPSFELLPSGGGSQGP